MAKQIEMMMPKTYSFKLQTAIYSDLITKTPSHVTKDASNVKHQKKTELHTIEMHLNVSRMLILIDMLHMLRKPLIFTL
jgi:hypothetical protein